MTHFRCPIEHVTSITPIASETCLSKDVSIDSQVRKGPLRQLSMPQMNAIWPLRSRELGAMIASE
jgi:hypothetical protein